MTVRWLSRCSLLYARHARLLTHTHTLSLSLSHTHTHTFSSPLFAAISINNTTMAQAVTAWMQANSAPAAPAPAAAHSYYDCSYTVTGSHVCNLHC